MARTWLDILDDLYAGAWNPDLKRHRSPFAFRGLPSLDHRLTSSLIRLADGRADASRLELALLRNFRKYARGNVVRADSTWDWLALAQHHGLPTRLLDWSYSPLVALHFATDNPDDFARDGIVWCVNFVEANKRLPAKLRRILNDEGSDTFTVEMLAEFRTLRDFDALASQPFVVFLEPPALDQRILNQLALFSLMSDPAAPFEEWLEQHPDLCRRVVVPAELKWEVRDKLDQANINERVLFPGLDGLSRWLGRYYTPAPTRGWGQAPARSSREGAVRDTATSATRFRASRQRSGGNRRTG